MYPSLIFLVLPALLYFLFHPVIKTSKTNFLSVRGKIVDILHNNITSEITHCVMIVNRLRESMDAITDRLATSLIYQVKVYPIELYSIKYLSLLLNSMFIDLYISSCFLISSHLYSLWFWLVLWLLLPLPSSITTTLSI